MNTTGRMITFEGIDGAGKTTQIHRLEALIAMSGHSVLCTREPGGTALGDRIRELLLNEDMGLETESLLFYAARAEHLNQVIRPSLEDGLWVISDRFADATYAYQTGGKGFDPKRLAVLESWTLGDFKPDLTVLFDLPPKVAQTRRAQRLTPDRFERLDEDFFERVRLAYLDRANADPERFLVVNAEACADDIFAQIEARVRLWL